MKRRPDSALARIDPETVAFQRLMPIVKAIMELMPKDRIDALRVTAMIDGRTRGWDEDHAYGDYQRWNRRERVQVTIAAWRALAKHQPNAVMDDLMSGGEAKGMHWAFPDRTLLEALERARRPDESLSEAILRLAGRLKK